MFIFDKTTIHDIEKYFLHTFVKFRETGDRIFKITGVHNDYVKAVDSSGFDIHIDLNESYKVDYVIPSRKIFQVDDQAYMLYRKPARQYYRGMHKENTGFDCLDFDGWKPLGFDFGIVERFINKDAYLQPMDVKKPKMLSIALNSQMALAGNGYLYFGFNRIGHLKFDSDGIKGVYKPIYQSEIKEQFKTLDVKWGVMAT